MARRNQKESYTDSRLYKASNYSEIRAVYSVRTKKGKDRLLYHSMFQNGQPSPPGTACRSEGGRITTLLQLQYRVLSQHKHHYLSQRSRLLAQQNSSNLNLTEKSWVESEMERMVRLEGRKGTVEVRIKEHVEFCQSISTVIWDPILSFTIHNSLVQQFRLPFYFSSAL